MNLADLTKDIVLPGPAGTAGGTEITGLTADSRRVRRGMIFAALPGGRIDGGNFAPDAQGRGAAAILLHSDADANGISVPVLRTREPRRALALMAARFYRRQPSVAVAVTGTNGKTSVVAFLRQFWAKLGYDAASLGTVGISTVRGHKPLSHTTPDPVTLHAFLAALADEGVTHLAMEASSHGLAQHRIDGVYLTAGAFTNITRDHLDYHVTFEDYLAAKLRLFAELLQPGQPAVIDADGPGANAAIAAATARGLHVFTVGVAGGGIRVLKAERHGSGQRLSLLYGSEPYNVLLPLAGAFQMSNALVAAGLALTIGGEKKAVFEALPGLQGAKGRLEHVGKTLRGAAVYIDYAHTPDALAKALQSLRPYSEGRLYVVFGCGGDRDPGKRRSMGEAAAAHSDVVYVTDDNPRSEDPSAIRREIVAGAPHAVEIGERPLAIASAIENLERGDVLLVAGKGHETGQIVGDGIIPYSDHDAIAAILSGGGT